MIFKRFCGFPVEVTINEGVRPHMIAPDSGSLLEASELLGDHLEINIKGRIKKIFRGSVLFLRPLRTPGLLLERDTS